MTDRPNVLLMTVDSLRADHVYGSLAETPAFDSLGADGVALEQAFAQGPFTTFSMPSLFTSKYPSQLTGIDFVEGVEGVLVADTSTIQERLRDAGYTTAGIHSNPLLSGLFGFDDGFDYFFDGLDDVTQRLPGRLTLLANKLVRLLRTTAYVPAADITDKTITWLRENGDEPFFLWVHYMDVHGPYQSRSGFTYPEKFRSEWLWRKAVHSPDEVTPEERARLRETYAEEVEYTDAAVGRLLDIFKDEGLYERTLVVLTADHGDEFAEHGSYSHENKLYDELIHVPLTVKPARVQNEIRPVESVPIPLLDVGATLVDAGDGRVDGFEGTSLFTETAGHRGSETEQGRRDSTPAIISEAQLPPEYACAIRTASLKYIETPDGSELYNLQEDPGETANVVTEHADVAADFRDRLEAHREYCELSQRSDSEVLDTDELNERLRRLGYIE